MKLAPSLLYCDSQRVRLSAISQPPKTIIVSRKMISLFPLDRGIAISQAWHRFIGITNMESRIWNHEYGVRPAFLANLTKPLHQNCTIEGLTQPPSYDLICANLRVRRSGLPQQFLTFDLPPFAHGYTVPTA